MDCEEIILSPNQDVTLLIENVEEHLPVSIVYWESGIQIYPKHRSPEWLIKFKDKYIIPG